MKKYISSLNNLIKECFENNYTIFLNIRDKEYIIMDKQTILHTKLIDILDLLQTKRLFINEEL